jgi:hypothetical protein
VLSLLAGQTCLLGRMSGCHTPCTIVGAHQQGHLRVYAGDSTVLFDSGIGTDSLSQGQRLVPGQTLSSSNGRYMLEYQVQLLAASTILACQNVHDILQI